MSGSSRSQRRFVFTPEAWEAAKEEVTQILRARVRSRAGPMTYGELVDRLTAIDVGPHDLALFELLGDVSKAEDAAGRGMLSALVVVADTGLPGDGFFVLASQLGRASDDRLDCWVSEVRRVEEASA